MASTVRKEGGGEKEKREERERGGREKGQRREQYSGKASAQVPSHMSGSKHLEPYVRV